MPEPLPKVPVETIIEDINQPKSKGVAVKIMVGLLILVVLSEVGYLVYNNFLKPDASLSGPSIRQDENINDVSQNPIEDFDQQTPASNQIVNNIGTDYFQSIIDFMQRPDVVFKNSTLSFSIEAKIGNIYTNIVGSDGTTYPYGLSLLQDNSEINIRFSQKELLTAKITDQFNPDESQNLNDLSIGDNIIFTVTTNLIKNSNPSFKIFITLLD